MRGLVGWLVALVVGVPSLGVAQAAAHVATDAQETALGAALYRRLAEERGLVPVNDQTRRIEAYLQGIADSLGRHTRRKLPWTIHYDPHAGLKSGFALPGGHVVVWAGIFAYMATEDEAAAIIAHEIAHIDDDQVSGRIDSLAKTKHRDVGDASQWRWQEFGASYGDVLENRCDYDGAILAVKAGYSPLGYDLLLSSFVALGNVHAPGTAAPKAITDRIAQIRAEITEKHWEGLTKTRGLQLP